MRILLAFALAFLLQTTHSQAQTWEVLKPDGVGFSAEFPGKPEYNETKGDDGATIRTYVLRGPAGMYDMTVWDLADGAVGPDDIDRVLDNIRDFSVAGINAQPRTEAKIEIDGNKARDLTADVMGMVWRARLTIARNKIYQIVAIVSKTEERSEATMRYLSSLRLIDAADSGAKK
jgi:hypothetical protein